MLFLRNMLSFLKNDRSMFELDRFLATYESMSDVTVTKEKGPVGAEGVLGNT